MNTSRIPVLAEATTADVTSRTLIVAKLRPGSEAEIAGIFRESDQTDLPHVVGVTSRALYSLGDLYVHLVETREDGPESVARGAQHPEFARISERLRPFVAPYAPDCWTSPRDAVATCFYTWRPPADRPADR